MEDVYEKENVNSDSAPTQEAPNSNTSAPSSENSNSISLPEPSKIAEEKEKSEILSSYVTDLSNFQKISFKIKNEKNEDKNYELDPDVNFEENKKGYYIFYNNNLEKLKEFFEAELKKLQNENPIILYHLSEFLEKKNMKYAEVSYRPDKYFSRLISFAYQDIVDKARSIAKNLIKIKEIEDNYGKDLKKRICEVVINDDKEHIFDDFISYGESFVVINKNNSSINNIVDLNERIRNLGIQKTNNDKEVLYLETEALFSELENNYKDKLTYIIELEKLLDVYLGAFGENVTETEKVKCLCFILNRASYYLSKTSEQLLADNSLEILRILSKLRKKINNLLLTYRYKFEQNKSPLLGIPIERYKSIIDTFEETSIYMQSDQIRKFIDELGNALERKANNLKKDKNFEPLTLDEIKEIAKVRDINLNSNDKIKEAIEIKIDEIEDKISANKSEIAQITLETGLETVEAGLVPEQNKKKALERINILTGENKRLDRQLKNYRNKLEKLNIEQNYDAQFFNILKLFSQLYRKNYDSRIDYSGLILTEKRKMAQVKDANGVMKLEEMINLREYLFKEISKNN